ncbi:hypothetical protein Emed_005356 [Eimeria media]
MAQLDEPNSGKEVKALPNEAAALPENAAEDASRPPHSLPVDKHEGAEADRIVVAPTSLAGGEPPQELTGAPAQDSCALSIDPDDDPHRPRLGIEGSAGVYAVELRCKDLKYSVAFPQEGTCCSKLYKARCKGKAAAPTDAPGNGEATEGRRKEILCLDGMELVFSPTDCVALMGSSGAGKSTLLNCLSGRVSTGMEGQVTLNGVPSTRQLSKELCSFIQQEDLIFGYLTVEEHLFFQARLRLPKGTEVQEARATARCLLDSFGLTHIAKSFIGGPHEAARGSISGGEKKRLCVATELLSSPSVIFADEPTSGLDSFMAQAVCDQLSLLAAAGCTVVCTIHQPSSFCFALFNKVRKHKAKLSSENAAEPYPECLSPCTVAGSLDLNEKALQEKPGDEGHVEDSPVATINTKASQRVMSTLSSIGAARKANKGARISPFTEAVILTKRAMLLRIRDPSTSYVRFASTLITAFIPSFIYFQLGWGLSDAWNRVSACYQIVLTQAMASLFAIANLFPQARPVAQREFEIAFWTMALAASVAKFFASLCVLLLGVLALQSYAYFISAIVRDEVVALAVIQVAQVVLSLFSGFMTQIDQLNIFWKIIAALSPFKYALAAFSLTILENEYFTGEEGQRVSGDDFLRATFGIKRETFYTNLIALAALIIL